MKIGNVLSATRRLPFVAVLAALPVLSCKKTVVAPPVATTVQISPATATLTALGQTTQFAAVVLDQDGMSMADEPVIWSTASGAIARVDANGLVTAVSVGATTVTAMAGTVTASAPVVVEQRVTAVALTPDEVTIEENEQVQILASATDVNGHAIANPLFQWTSSRSSVASVSQNGLVSAMSAGETRISATSGGVIGSATVTVEDSGVATLTVTPAADTLRIRETVQLTATGRDRNGVVMPGLTPTWSSSSTTVATVSNRGLVTARAAGTATVTARVEDKTASATITVSSLPADDHGSSFATATRISYGDTLTGRLDAGDEDFFEIRVSGTAKTVRLTAWATGSTDTRGYLYNDKGAELTNDDDDGPGRNFQVARSVAPGTYYVKVVGYQASTTGAYTIKVDDHGDSQESATNVTGNTSGALGKSGNVDYFHFKVTTAGTLILEGTGSTDTQGELQRSNGDTIKTSDDDGADQNFKIESASLATGDYYLKVTGYNNATGSYGLTVGGTATLGAASSGSGNTGGGNGNTGGSPNTSNNTRQTAHYMEFGHVASDAIGSGDQRDWFAVRVRRSVATEGTVRLTAYTVGSAKVSMFLSNDVGTVLVAANPDGAAPPAVQVVRTVDTDKYYYIMVRGRRTTDRGGYQIKVDDHGDSRATATDLGNFPPSDIVGGLVAAGNVDYFKFKVTGTATDSTAVTISTTGSVDTYGELQSSNGGRIDSNDNESKTQKNFKIVRADKKRLRNDRTYYVLVRSTTGSTGEYTLVIS